MNIQEYYQDVKHTDNCSVCAVTQNEPVLGRVVKSAGFLWFLVFGLIVGAYTLAVWQLNNIVGGLR